MCSVAHLCQTLCNSVDCRPLGSSVHGNLQAILEWVAISYSRGSSHPRESDPRLSSLLHWQAHSLLPGKSYFIHSSVSTGEGSGTHSSTFAWEIPWTEKPGRLQSMGSLESDTTERLHLHSSLSCIGEGNGNPLQCSRLENPRDRGACRLWGLTESDTTEAT